MSSLAAHLQRHLESVSGVARAWVSACGTPTLLRVTSQRSVKDPAGGRPRTALHTSLYSSATGHWHTGGVFPLDASVVHASPSPSGARIAVLRTVAEPGATPSTAGAGGAVVKVISELWCTNTGTLLRSVSSEGLHGAPLVDGWFGTEPSWSPDEALLAYVAEPLAAHVDAPSVFASVQATAPSADATAPLAPSPLELRTKADWGEKYVGVRCPRIYVIDWAAGRVVCVTGIAPHLSAGQPTFAPHSSNNGGSCMLVYTAWPDDSIRLGMTFVTSRACRLYTVDIATLLQRGIESTPTSGVTSSTTMPVSPPVHACLTPSEPVSRSPRISPDGAHLAYLSMAGAALQLHCGASALRVLPWRDVVRWYERASSAAMGGLPPSSVATAAVPSVPAALCIPAHIAPSAVIVPTVEDAWEGRGLPRDPTLISHDHSWFPSLYTHALTAACWAPDSSALWVATHRGSRNAIIRVSIHGSGSGAPWAWEECVGARALLRGGGASADASLTLFSAAGGGGDVPFLLVGVESPSEPLALALVWGTQASPCPTSSSVLGHAQSCAHPASVVQPPPRLSCAACNADAVAVDVRAMQWRVMPVRPTPETSGAAPGASAPRESDYPFEAILIHGAPPASGMPLPLLVIPHGGPHSAFATTFVPHYAFLTSLGFAVLLVNYRGSLGFGEGSTASLPGRCGTADVSDVVQATLLALALGGWAPARSSPALAPANAVAAATLPPLPITLDGSRVGISGGSHGGFLAAHLISNPATRPLFRTALMRNPVTNIATMVGVSDIPEWCWIESLGQGAFPPTVALEDEGTARPHPLISGEALQHMWRCSPAAHTQHVRTRRAAASGCAATDDARATTNDLIAPGDPIVRGAALAGVARGAREAVDVGRALAAVSLVDADAPCPTLVLLGMKDRRVPPSQGIEWYNAVRAAEGEGAAGVPASLQCIAYPDDTHALDTPKSEGDAWVRMGEWLRTHL